MGILATCYDVLQTRAVYVAGYFLFGPVGSNRLWREEAEELHENQKFTNYRHAFYIVCLSSIFQISEAENRL